MQHARRYFLLACFIPLCAFSSFSETSHRFLTLPEVHVRWLDVYGATLADARQYLAEHGPKDIHGNSRYAVTEWTVRWKWPTQEGVPQFDRTTTDAEIRFTLPRWAPKDLPSIDEQRTWANMYAALLQHEFDHARQALNTAKNIEKAIKKISKRRTLSTQEAHLLARRLVKRNNEWDINYDQRTRNGQVQGVTLQPTT